MAMRIGGRADWRPEARRSWTIRPAERATHPPAIFLPGQLDLARGLGIETSWRLEEERLLGGARERAPTRAYELRDALLDGAHVLLGRSWMALGPRRRRLLSLGATPRRRSGALACTYAGGKFFGHWVKDDAPLSLLAARHDEPVATARPLYAHEPRYAALMGLDWTRLPRARFDRLLAFDDPMNADRGARLAEMRRRLGAGPPGALPGAFIRRGRRGARRSLANEAAVEAALVRRGYLVIEPEAMTSDEIAARLRGVGTVVSVEGSQMAHGILALRDGGALVALTPPARLSNYNKEACDVVGLRYGLVIGRGVSADGAFEVDPGELSRTLDLVDRAT